MILSIITVPMATSIAIFLFGRFLGQKGSVFLSIISIIISMIGGLRLIYRYIKNNEEITISIYNWINTGMLKIPINLYYDKYSIFMVFLITTITFIVITYSTWYMYKDPHKIRFLSILLMFAVAMLILVSSSNLFFIFIGWEGVGIMSYLLINFWYNSINSNKSAIKAILYNKIGDIGFLIAISLIVLLFSNTTFISFLPNTTFFSNTTSFFSNTTYNSFFTFLLLGVITASIAKSAQIFLHPWLGDAMAGPTPVSALLHAATMVTGGVYLLFRLENIIKEDVMISTIIVIVGLFTIIFGGLSSINQYDIKKIIAYSTCSQLGYMFLTNGLLIPNIGLFHLLTHGFFKAMLFLTAGIIIHCCANDEQDIRKFGSFIFYYPMSFFLFLLGSLSILSFPFLSGFYSKEAILESSLSPQFPIYIYILMILGALFTSIYSFKLIYYTFLSKPNFNYSLGSGFEFSLSIKQFSFIFGMIILVLGSIFFGYFTKEIVAPFMGGDYEFFPFYIKLIPLFFSISGIFLAFIIINPWKYRVILTILNKRLFFDSLVNYFFAFKFLTLGYLYCYKIIDRGLLEFIGFGLIRILFSIPFYFYNQNQNQNQNTTIEYNPFFFYLFFSFFFLFFCILV